MEDLINIFNHFATDFEQAVEDDHWTRLEKYFTEDATYTNIGLTQAKCEGKETIVSFFRDDISQFDRQFDSRELIGLASPKVDGNRLSRPWRTIYKHAGIDELMVEGEARYLFEGNLIKAIEQELTPTSMKTLSRWMQKNGEKLGVK